ncbi:MAG: CHAT domain-containing protein [Candidatus Eisenbacteria bacterium]|uniref:CHAT domain-containing protein n=1 Tax=Eiseniibacteriota bacterium TaxID=2212470 RepID=A0A933W2U1_UNCEI|nr:CHAT domain-containing protein [Candidatus Eisenbacteria bacterium]
MRLRAAGQFQAALALARARERVLAEDPRTAGWQLAEARFDRDALVRIVSAPESVRRAFALAESLVPDDVRTEENWGRTLPALRTQLASRSRLLGEEHPDVAATRSALARVECALGDAAAARVWDELALACRRRAFGEVSPWVAESNDQLGRDWKLSGYSRETAFGYFERAERVARRVCDPNSRELGRVVLDFANVHRQMNKREKCYALFREALAIARRAEGDSSLTAAEVLADWGVSCVRFGDDDEAIAHYREAIRLMDGAADTMRPALPMALHSLGTLLARRGQLVEARVLLRRAAEVQERRHSRMRPDQGRSLVAPIAAWADCAFAMLQLGDSTSAFETLQRSVARGTLERRFDPAALASDSVWTGLGGRLGNSLPESTALIGWLESRPSSHLRYPFFGFVLRRGAPVRWVRFDDPAPDSPEWADLWTSEFRNSLRASAAWPVGVEPTPDLDSMATVLWRLRIAPFEPELVGVRDLLVLSSSVNNALPLEIAKGPDGRWLSDRFAIGYVPSALLLAHDLDSPPRARAWGTNALLVGAPRPVRPTPGDIPLLEAGTELSLLHARLPRALLLRGAAASEARMRELARDGRLAQFDLVHFATHHKHDLAFSGDAAIVLAEANAVSKRAAARFDSTDGRLTIDELESWRLSARLAVLATCQSMGMRDMRGDGLNGHATAMQHAGAHCVVASLWNADDRATALLVDHFYAELLAPGVRAATPVRALQRARIAVRDWHDSNGRQPYRHPVYWASFVLLGHPW